MAILGACGAAWLGRAALGPDDDLEDAMEPADDHSSVARAWRRIETWMASDAPEALSVLRSGADAKEIRQLGDLVGPLPEPLRRSLARHDGQTWEWPSLVEYGMLMPAADMAEHWEMSLKYSAGADEPWRREWLQFASRDGDYLFISLESMDGHPAGSVWQFRHDNEPMLSVVASSYEAWLERWAEELESGVFALDRGAGAGLLPARGRKTQVWPE